MEPNRKCMPKYEGIETLHSTSDTERREGEGEGVIAR